MCKESKLVTMPDKFFKRKASAVLIRCPYKESECEWVGEVGGSKQHIAACPKRPWECEHCDFTSTFDVGIQHIEQCTKYPVPCPNECDVGTIPRCDVEKHRTECPLEPVACQFADVGCSVKVARRDLKLHMEESQQTTSALSNTAQSQVDQGNHC
jgi:TNF receptor-associated factor 4